MAESSHADWWMLVVAIAATLVGLWQLREAGKQRATSISMTYLSRYWDIQDALLVTDKQDPEHRRQRHRYLILCEDEFEAARQGWLAPGIWSIWHSWLSDGHGRKRLEQDVEAVGRAEFAHVRNCLASPPGHSWRQCKAFRRTRRS